MFDQFIFVCLASYFYQSLRDLHFWVRIARSTSCRSRPSLECVQLNIKLSIIIRFGAPTDTNDTQVLFFGSDGLSNNAMIWNGIGLPGPLTSRSKFVRDISVTYDFRPRARKQWFLREIMLCTVSDVTRPIPGEWQTFYVSFDWGMCYVVHTASVDGGDTFETKKCVLRRGAVCRRAHRTLRFWSATSKICRFAVAVKPDHVAEILRKTIPKDTKMRENPQVANGDLGKFLVAKRNFRSPFRPIGRKCRALHHWFHSAPTHHFQKTHPRIICWLPQGFVQSSDDGTDLSWTSFFAVFRDVDGHLDLGRTSLVYCLLAILSEDFWDSVTCKQSHQSPGRKVCSTKTLLL